MRRVAVVGAGVAGCAAAWAARRAGAEVVLVGSGPGATGQSSGAMDLEPWFPGEQRFGSVRLPKAREALSTPLSAFVVELFRVGFGDEASALHFLAEERAASFAATSAGVVRSAVALDPSLLDLGQVPTDGLILLADVARPDFPAALLASAFSASCQGRWRFAAAPLRGLLDAREVELPLAALGTCWGEDRERALIESCRALLAMKGASAVLLGPWLGGAWGAVVELRRQGLLVGETTSPPDGPAGARLVRALDRMMVHAGVIRRHATVREILSRESGLELAGLELAGLERQTERVIVATGGLVGGGVVLQHGPGATFRVPLLPDFGDDVGSLRGYDASADSGRFLRSGAQQGVDTAHLGEGLLAAGEVVRGSHFSLLAAAESGLQAGLRAATE